MLTMFEYGGIYLRPLEEKDLEKIRKTRNDPSTWMNLTDIDLIDSQSQKDWFKTLSRQRKSKRFYAVCSGKDRFVGLVRMDEFDWVNRSVRVGCDVAKSLRGKGYGSKIMEMVSQYGFRYLNMHRLWLLVLDFNSAARRVYEKSGFRVEGRYRKAIYRSGKYHDYIIMSLLKEEWKG
ncbi:MAG: hypothetical protein A2901_08515 [Elusimicrobia bacterium RIFCSPLOWO2_01_FULL_54_10]|nr:MAG: hypothetical protein A2901_08515 [Elusimicrobia bacterium RIFCSPLOWO2_01_FULL_54_10]